VVRSAFDCPVSARPATATTAKVTFANTFQTPVAEIATAFSFALNPHTRSAWYENARPIASPPGSTLEAAVEACDMISARVIDSPGSAAIQGGANVSRLMIAAPARIAMSRPDRLETTSSTSP
jgi:hypothetical protein